MVRQPEDRPIGMPGTKHEDDDDDDADESDDDHDNDRCC